MSQNARLSVGLVFALAIAVVVVLVAGGGEETEPPSADQESSSAGLIRDDSHYLDKAGESAPTLVEFLDFECEGCGALYPVIEELREKYAGEINFVVRYFPNEGHFNARASAHAAEAAARQGEFEAMYGKLFETQAEWGEAQVSKAETFLGFAEELGLDMEQFQADVNSPEVEARVEKDLKDGLALGVAGTPTLFLDGQQLQLTSVEQLEADIEAAVEQ